jgi:hypothetical protein
MENKIEYLFFVLNDLDYCAKNKLADVLVSDLKKYKPEAYKLFEELFSNHKAKEVAALLKEPLC